MQFLHSSTLMNAVWKLIFPVVRQTKVMDHQETEQEMDNSTSV